jgi:MFS family permease
MIRRLLINRNYALLFAGQSISVMGDEVFTIALAIWIALDLGRGQAWAPAAVSGVMVAWSLPMVLVGVVAGVYVDRWPKRRTMLVTDAARTGLILSAVPVATLALPVPARLGLLYAAVFLATAGSQFFNPSRTALIGDLVPEKDRARASGLGQIAGSIASIAGPPLGSILLVGLGLTSVLLLDACSFLVSFLMVLLVRVPTDRAREGGAAARSFRTDFAEGLRFFAGNRVLMALLVSGVIIMLGAGAINALDVFFAVHNLHVGATQYGVLSAAFGAGALVGAVALSGTAQRIGLTRLVWGGISLAGLAMMAYSRLTSFVPAAAVIFLLGAAIAGPNVAAMPLILRETPRDRIGRVSAVLNPFMQGAGIVSMLVAGALVGSVLHGLSLSALRTHFGPVDTVFLVSGLLSVAGGLYAAWSLRTARKAAADRGGATAA